MSEGIAVGDRVFHKRWPQILGVVWVIRPNGRASVTWERPDNRRPRTSGTKRAHVAIANLRKAGAV